MAGIARILPAHEVVEIADGDPILQVVYRPREHFQVSGFQIVWGQPYERGGIVPHWRAVLDPRGRVVVAICFNMDLDDAWERADHPRYPECLVSLACRIGVNYIVYARTH